MEQVRRDLAEIAEIRCFDAVLAQLKEERFTGGDLTKHVIREIPGGRETVDSWFEKDAASTWRDLSPRMKEIIAEAKKWL